MKILFIAPHLSTGGSPQYLLRKIKELIYDNEIFCIEYSDVTGGVLVVQRNQIKDLLAERLITLGENKNELVNYIKSIKPDIIHFEELPEYFCDKHVAKNIYTSDRLYKIVETSHDSSFDITTKLFFPDYFIFVSEYQKKLFSPLNIPSDVVEYPIEYKKKTADRDKLLLGLGLNPKLKHVINVGLFTPRKNQSEIIEYARMLENYPIQFHFIGNQADNFKWYWEPLMKNFPSNCKWWNERKDVDTFYEIADLFLFTSRGNISDKETMPLVIREAIGWNVPSLIYNLTVYLDYFNNYKNIEYLDYSNKELNCNKILKMLNLHEISKINKHHDYKIWSDWDVDNQFMYFGCEENIDIPIIVSIKEYMSDAVLWFDSYDSLKKECKYWICPHSPNYRNYKYDRNISGVKICIYDKNTKEQLYEKPYYFKFSDKPNIRLSNFIPYYINYEEFFVNKKYDKFFDKSYKNVVDVGANIGVFTKYLIHNKITSRIIAVECDPLALQDLKRNYMDDNRVVIVEKALHYDTNPISFYHNEKNPVISTSVESCDSKKIDVETVTISELLKNLTTIDLLKLDIEGSEYDILMKTDTSLYDHINNIFMECHFFKDGDKEKFENTIKFLTDLNYEIVDIFNVLGNFIYQGSSEAIFFRKKK